MTTCGKVGPRGVRCREKRGHGRDVDHKATSGSGRVWTWPVRPEGKPAKPVSKIRVAADGTPEVKLSGIPLATLEEIEAHAAKYPLRYRSRNALIALCAIAGWESLQRSGGLPARGA